MNNPSNFTQREIAAALQIWNRAAVSLLDIRHNLISPEGALSGYRLPASTFLFTSGGKADVTLNDTVYNVERFGLFHGGKGTELTIIPRCDWLEYYLVLYKAVEPPLQRREYLQLMEQVNPFRQQYGFSPRNPLFFSEELRKIYEKWTGPTPLNLFYGKTAFYRCVYEIYEELEQGHIRIFEPDAIAMAGRYLNEHYCEPISLRDMCEALGISYSHFHRSFKQQTGKSPQEYLIHLRLCAAQELLNKEGITIREVAAYCGFQDERNFQRLFLKHTGLSPNAYRQNTPLGVRGETVGNPVSFPYNWERQVSLDEPKGKGAIYMFKQMRSKAVFAAALSLVLLMSACGTVPANAGGSEPALTSAATTQASGMEATAPVEKETKTIGTVKGDVEVPLNPKRIISYYISGNIYAFDIEPVGIDSAYEGAGFAGLVKTAQTVDFNNAEEIMALEPDLIILSNDYFYDDMAKIAPTVYVPYQMPLEEQITFLGKILSREEKAKEIMANYKETVENKKQTLADAGLLTQTVTVVEGGNTSMRIHGPTYVGAPSILYSAFGFKAPSKVQEEILDLGKSGSDFSLETLPQYTGDILVQFVWEGMDDMSANPVWTSLPAVKNGKLIEIPFSMAHYPDVLSQIQQVEYLCGALLALQ